MKKSTLLVGAVVVVSVGALAFPVKQPCGVVGFTCPLALDAAGNVYHFYERQPLIAEAYEAIAGSNFPFRYSSGMEIVIVAPGSA